MSPGDAEVIAKSYSTSMETLVDMVDNNEEFRGHCRAARTLLREGGGEGGEALYRLKARALAGEQLEALHRLATDADVPPVVREKAIALTARLADLDPGTRKPPVQNEGRGRVQVVFQFGPGLPGRAGGPNGLGGPLVVDAIETTATNDFIDE